MALRDEISNRKHDFELLCQRHKVKYLYAFGSSLTSEFNHDHSDIDLLVEIEAKDPIGRGELLISLWDTFESFLRRKVDLLTYPSIKNPF